ncbi:MAG: hypothetical protein ACI3ZQ_05010 [Candidatus Cryptobacteroides sp.]
MNDVEKITALADMFRQEVTNLENAARSVELMHSSLKPSVASHIEDFYQNIMRHLSDAMSDLLGLASVAIQHSAADLVCTEKEVSL